MKLCEDIDHVSLEFNGSGDIALQYSSQFLFTTDGFAYKYTQGFMRSFQPTMSAGGVAITLGNGTLTGRFQRMYLDSDWYLPAGNVSTLVTPAGTLPLTLFYFEVDFVKGSTTTIPAGILNFGDAGVAGADPLFAPYSVEGQAIFVQSSSPIATRDLVTGRFPGRIGVELMTRAGVRSTNTSPITFGTGDELHFSGWALDTDIASLS